MKEGKSMEKKVEERYPLNYAKSNAPEVMTLVREHNANQVGKREAFIAGWQEQDKEIERLKGLLRKEFEKSFRFPKRVNMDAEWEHYSNSNNL